MCGEISEITVFWIKQVAEFPEIRIEKEAQVSVLPEFLLGGLLPEDGSLAPPGPHSAGRAGSGRGKEHHSQILHYIRVYI